MSIQKKKNVLQQQHSLRQQHQYILIEKKNTIVINNEYGLQSTKCMHMCVCVDDIMIQMIV